MRAWNQVTGIVAAPVRMPVLGTQESVYQEQNISFCLEVDTLLEVHIRFPPFSFHPQKHGRTTPKTSDPESNRQER